MRHLYFRIRYNQWFKNENGVKGFADQCINWILRKTLPLAKKLRIENQQLNEKLTEYSKELEIREISPIVPTEEFPAIRTKVRQYSIAKWFFVIGELFFNFFAAASILSATGWVAVTGQFLIAIIMTYCFILLFEEVFEELLNFKKYKSIVTPERNVLKLIVLSIIAIIYLVMVYYLCHVRGIEIEGGTGSGIISTLMMLLGMLSPVLAGYYDYQKSLIIGPYKNTIQCARLTNLIANNTKKIAVNNQRMRDQFKVQSEDKYALLQEFKVYKANYNLKRSKKNENLDGHFAKEHDTFIKEAQKRFDDNISTDLDLRTTGAFVKNSATNAQSVLPLNSKNNKRKVG